MLKGCGIDCRAVHGAVNAMTGRNRPEQVDSNAPVPMEEQSQENQNKEVGRFRAIQFELYFSHNVGSLRYVPRRL